MKSKILYTSILVFGLIIIAWYFLASGKYDEKIVGNQIWMSKNLEVSKFRNGDPIPEAKTNEEWKKAGENKQPAWCYYDNDPTKGAKYGKLYNWYAVNDPRGIAPDGWHVPTNEDWKALISYLGGPNSARERMISTRYYKNNRGGLAYLAGGYRYPDGIFTNIGYCGFWWNSSEKDIISGWHLSLFINYVGLDYLDKACGFSVRCIKD